jgi:hypothetical protein
MAVATSVAAIGAVVISADMAADITVADITVEHPVLGGVDLRSAKRLSRVEARPRTSSVHTHEFVRIQDAAEALCPLAR